MTTTPSGTTYNGYYCIAAFDATTGSYEIDPSYVADSHTLSDDPFDENLNDGVEAAGESVRLEYTANGYLYDGMVYSGFLIDGDPVVVDADGQHFLLTDNAGLGGSTGEAMAGSFQYGDALMLRMSAEAFGESPMLSSIMGGSGNDLLTGTAGADSICGLAGRDRLEGLAGNDSLRGGAWADTLAGGEGNDTLKGEYGNDVLLGGPGSDMFCFSTTLVDGTLDVVRDFAPGVDKIVISKALTNLIQTGSLWGERLAFGTVAAERDDRFVFDSASGTLYYDADGSGTAHSAMAFARLEGEVSLSAADIVIA